MMWCLDSCCSQPAKTQREKTQFWNDVLEEEEKKEQKKKQKDFLLFSAWLIFVRTKLALQKP